MKRVGRVHCSIGTCENGLHAFFISGHEGDARIYDPAGRLVLSKEIKGKTLISPLSPGVYFVVAGKQMAKVAVR